MTEKCERTGCTHGARWLPKLNVPAIGWPVDLHQSMSVIMGLKLCDTHYDDWARDTPADVRDDNPELAKAIEFMAAGKVPPDFARAFWSQVRVGSDEHRKFEELRQRGRQ